MITYRSLSSLTVNQLHTLESLLEMLKILGVYQAWYLGSRRYMDTVKTYKLGVNNYEWCDLYDVEEVLIANSEKA